MVMEIMEDQHLIQDRLTHRVVAEEPAELAKTYLADRTQVMVDQEEVFLELMDLELIVDHSAAVAAEVHTKEVREDLAEDLELETELHKETQTEVMLLQQTADLVEDLETMEDPE